MKSSSTIFLSVASLVYIIMIMFLYFTKKQVKTSENKIYKKLLIMSFISLISEISITTIPVETNTLLFDLSLKTYLLCCILWLSFFMEYVFVITRESEDKTKGNFKNTYPHFYLIFWTLIMATIILVLLLPIYFYDTPTIKYSYGPSVNVVFIITSIYIMIMICLLIKNRKSIKEKGYIPIYIFIILMITVAITQKINPGLLLSNFTFALLTSLMYHTIENPDIKMMKELLYAKNIADNSKQRTTETLNEISNRINNSLEKAIILGYKKISTENPKILKKELKNIQKQSVKLTEEISGMIELAKIKSGELTVKEEKYELSELLDNIKEMIDLENSNTNIECSIRFSNKINPVLYGDYYKVSQTVIKLFSYLSNIIEKGKIDLYIDNVNSGRFCRLKFHFKSDKNDKIKNYLVIKQKPFVKDSLHYLVDDVKLYGTNSNVDYSTIQNLLDLLNAKIKVITYENNYDIVLSIDQKINSSYQIVSNYPENKDIHIKYKDFSSKRLLIVNDKRGKVKELLVLLYPYNIDIDVAVSLVSMEKYLESNIAYDMVLIDGNLREALEEDYNLLPKKINSLAGYTLNTIILLNSIENNDIYIEKGYKDVLIKPINKNTLNKVLNDYLN